MRRAHPFSTRQVRSRSSLSVLLATGALFACAGQPAVPSAPLPAARVGFPVYDGTVSIDPASGAVQASWKIRFVRSAGTADSVILLLNGALTISRVGGPGVLSHSEQVQSDNNRVTVRFARPPPAETPTEIGVEYAGVPKFGEDSINGIRPGWIELGLDSFWHPVFEGFAQAITARLRLTLPPTWMAVASGSVTGTGGTLLVNNDVPLIDIAFAASPSLAHLDGDRIRVYHAGGKPAVVAQVLATAGACARYLDARYGSRNPLPPVQIVLAPRGGPGYARKNYIVMTGTADTAVVPLTRFVCHELAHFWSSGAIASGPENWLNEAFAEYVSARYIRATMGDSAYATIVAQWRQQSEGLPAIWSPAATARPSARTAYRKAPFLLHRLEERVGPQTMDRILVRFMVESLRTTPELIDMIGEVAGALTAAWFREQLAS